MAYVWKVLALKWNRRADAVNSWLANRLRLLALLSTQIGSGTNSESAKQFSWHYCPHGKASCSHVHVFLGQVLSRIYTGSSRAMANTEDTRKTVLITG
jgi:hypothetical protein